MNKFYDVRVFFSKTDECKFVGHLDVNRIITRSIQKCKLPIWRTEGFNVHPYITFSNPLSLGFSSLCESFDIRLVDEDYDISAIPEMINKNLPKGLRCLSCALPKYKSSEITKALYEVKLTTDNISLEELYSIVKEMLESTEILVEKKTKKGFKEINLVEYLSTYDLELTCEYVVLKIALPSGGGTNINPNLFIKYLEDKNNIQIYPNILREKMFVENGEEFK